MISFPSKVTHELTLMYPLLILKIRVLEGENAKWPWMVTDTFPWRSSTPSTKSVPNVAVESSNERVAFGTIFVDPGYTTVVLSYEIGDAMAETISGTGTNGNGFGEIGFGGGTTIGLGSGLDMISLHVTLCQQVELQLGIVQLQPIVVPLR